jgi:hypothetical protein
MPEAAARKSARVTRTCCGSTSSLSCVSYICGYCRRTARRHASVHSACARRSPGPPQPSWLMYPQERSFKIKWRLSLSAPRLYSPGALSHIIAVLHADPPPERLRELPPEMETSPGGENGKKLPWRAIRRAASKSRGRTENNNIKKQKKNKQIPQINETQRKLRPAHIQP